MSTRRERIWGGHGHADLIEVRPATLQDLMDAAGIKPGDSVEVQQEKVAAGVPYLPQHEHLLVEAGLL